MKKKGAEEVRVRTLVSVSFFIEVLVLLVSRRMRLVRVSFRAKE